VMREEQCLRKRVGFLLCFLDFFNFFFVIMLSLGKQA